MAQVVSENRCRPSSLSLYNLISSFTIGSTTYNPLDYFDLTQCKLYAIPVYTRINESVSVIDMEYTPSTKALAKTTIKVKDMWTPLNEDLNNAYLNITGTNLSTINYKLDYYALKSSVSNTCDLMDCEIMQDNFWTSFIFTNPTGVLKSYGINTIDKVNYTKIKDNYLDINDNYLNTEIKFRDAYTK
jgi:hypothetical protein